VDEISFIDPGWEKIRIQDGGKSGSGKGNNPDLGENIPDPQH